MKVDSVYRYLSKQLRLLHILVEEEGSGAADSKRSAAAPLKIVKARELRDWIQTRGMQILSERQHFLRAGSMPRATWRNPNVKLDLLHCWLDENLGHLKYGTGSSCGGFLCLFVDVLRCLPPLSLTTTIFELSFHFQGWQFAFTWNLSLCVSR